MRTAAGVRIETAKDAREAATLDGDNDNDEVEGEALADAATADEMLRMFLNVRMLSSSLVC